MYAASRAFIHTLYTHTLYTKPKQIKINKVKRQISTNFICLCRRLYTAYGRMDNINRLIGFITSQVDGEQFQLELVNISKNINFNLFFG